MTEARKSGKSTRVKHGGKHAYFNRELSWLAFNRRVLDQAACRENPLIERLKFLAIASSNLDEFFEIRVAGLIQQVESGILQIGVDGLGAKEQLRRIHDVVGSLVEYQYHCFRHEMIPELDRNGIRFLTVDQLTKSDLRWVNQYFREQVLPVLTPLAIDPAHPFPQIANKALNVLVCLHKPNTDEERETIMAVVPVPRILPRLVRIGTGTEENLRFVFLSDVIKLCAAALFTGYEIRSAKAFRITRNSDLFIDEEEAGNFLEQIEEELKHRQKGAAVRLEIENGVPEEVLYRLLHHIDLPGEYVFRIDGPINLMRLMSVYDSIDRPELKYPPFQPLLRGPSGGGSMFKAISGGEMLLHHPYDSFAPVVEFIQQASRDPDVFAIKQTLYRTSGDSPIVRALIEASRNGKQVTALVELKARFDEANNIQWAKQLEEAGVHVVYGMVGLKIHCKCSLVVRREGSALRRYVHLGTGNYNPQTARLYTDLSFFTDREEITADVALLFNTLTGFGLTPEFNRLLVAPFHLHARLQEYILAEAENARRKKPARIIAKLNSLVDQTTIDNLYRASAAGVEIDLILRGTCCLVPGVPGLSENIRVRSIVGRFLEHSRIYYFANHGGSPRFLAGSADWMPRNFFRRVEVIFPIDEPRLQQEIRTLLDTYLRDNVQARRLLPSGGYVPIPVGDEEAPFSAQNVLLKRSAEAAAQGSRAKG